VESHELEEIKRYFDVVAESLRGDIKAIAEGHIISNRKIDDLREQNEKEHKEILSEVKSSYGDLNHRVSILEDK
jgi:hypothetical protein